MVLLWLCCGGAKPPTLESWAGISTGESMMGERPRLLALLAELSECLRSCVQPARTGTYCCGWRPWGACCCW